jgi:Core-2/I-Branching enzyme
MINKHAYLIISHNEFYILEKLITLLDDYRNDIYIHIDKKVKDFDFDYYKNLVTKSKLIFVNRMDVRWGDFTQIESELTLLKEAVKSNYKYYHLLSGVDLPLKSQDYIHEFFNKNSGKEFVHFCRDEQTKKVLYRIKHYHFMKHYRSKNKCASLVVRILNKISNVLQSPFSRNLVNDIEIKYGANWFSITNDFALYVLSKEEWIRKNFKHTYCADEIFLQTILYNSKFRENIFHKNMDDNYIACMRYIDWNRGNPYTFRENDIDDLINSDKLFARKFSAELDKKVIDRISNHVNNN